MRKELSESQRLLIIMTRKNLAMAQADMQNTVNLVAYEMGIPEGERWRLSEDDKAFIRDDVPQPKPAIPGRKMKAAKTEKKDGAS
jgi:hypothetical protein